MEDIVREVFRTCLKTVIVELFGQPAQDAPAVVTMPFQSETIIQHQEITDRRETQPATIQKWRRTQEVDWNDYGWHRERTD